MCGQGTTKYTNGNVYVGTCKANVKHGNGSMVWASGDRFDGEWEKGLIHGKGTFTYSDGGKYEGEWEHDQRHGQGTMKHANGNAIASISTFQSAVCPACQLASTKTHVLLARSTLNLLSFTAQQT